MKRKIIWLVVTCIMVAALLLASCGPTAPVEKPTAPSEGKPAAPKEVKPTAPAEKEAVPAAKKPTYGGWLAYAGTPLIGLDEAYTYPWSCYTLYFTNDELLTGDWAKGPGGTGEASWQSDEFFLNLERGWLAESWEIPDEHSVIYHIRKGVMFHNKPPVNGRQMNAEDVAFSLNRLLKNPRAYINWYTDGGKYPKVTVLDKWTVEFRYPDDFPPARRGELLRLGDFFHVLPKEVGEKNIDLGKWENSIGTGPFMLVDYVSDSAAILKRNPNYWAKDPLHPENTLPYLDGVKMMNIPDASTALAAFRTGKLDYMFDVGWDSWDELVRANPKLQYLEHLRNYSWNLWLRADRHDIPLGDVRVRQALSMAIDRQKIIDQVYHGRAESRTYPLAPLKEFLPMYTPMNKLPPEVQELYKYNPGKAKQLLAEAGYPNGFKTKVLVYAGIVDDMALIKDYFAAIGVDMTLDAKEWGTYSYLAFTTEDVKDPTTGGIKKVARWPEMCYRYAGTNISHGFLATYVKSTSEYPEIVEFYDKLMLNQMDQAKIAQLWQEFNPWHQSQMFWIEYPTPYVYTMWQPWLKGYHGERGIGHCNAYAPAMYLWIDQDLKESMIGKR